MASCPIHNVEFRIVPAGVSKKTGRPYNEFYACPERGCTSKPSSTENAYTVQSEPVAIRQGTTFGQGEAIIAHLERLSLQLDDLITKLTLNR